MKENLSTILLLIAIIAPASAFVVFWVGKILNLRKEIIELQMKQQFQQKNIDDIQKDIDQLRNELNQNIWHNKQ